MFWIYSSLLTKRLLSSVWRIMPCWQEEMSCLPWLGRFLEKSPTNTPTEPPSKCLTNWQLFLYCLIEVELKTLPTDSIEAFYQKVEVWCDCGSIKLKSEVTFQNIVHVVFVVLFNSLLSFFERQFPSTIALFW